MSLRPNFGLYLIYLLIYNVHLFKSVSKHDIITSSDHKSLQSLIARTGVYMKVLLSHSISVYWLNVSYLIQYPCTGWSFVSNAVSMYWLKFRIPCIQYPCTGWSFVDVNYKHHYRSNLNKWKDKSEFKWYITFKHAFPR